MKLPILKLTLITVLVLASSCWNNLLAIDENYAGRPLTGTGLRKDSFSVVADEVYFNPLLKPLQINSRIRNLITFRIDESKTRVLPVKFTATLKVKVFYKKANGAGTIYDSTGLIELGIKYDRNSPYPYRAIQLLKDAVEAKVVIKEITVVDTTLAGIEDVLILENEMFINREYQFNAVTNTISSVSFNQSEIASNGELVVSWAKDRAADEYDLEWTYIDDLALSEYISAGIYNANKIFLRNATRVSLTATEYRIPLLYDIKGHLFFRVRAVQVKSNGQRIEANWSSSNIQNLGDFAWDGHEPDLNWQASTSFAEEGKRKSVVQYFDGSLRGRQTVTKDNTTNKTIIAENFYDHQGRPVIQVMPSPTLKSIIEFTPRFNTINNNGEYDKELFDKDFNPADACEAGAPAMDSANGASGYYSSSNPLSASGLHQYIPKAMGYPFTEVRYLPDNTGRISMQSGVGPTFQIGQRATRYYYGTPEQEELDALFGTEVGKSSHYFKNMVRDANGQYSISYVDMLGRTIATALAGNAPVSLQPLESNKSVMMVKKLLDESNNIIKGTSIESSRSMLVPREDKYIFRYSLIPDKLTILDCQTLPVCYDCRYDLEITIADECGNAPVVIRKNNVSLETGCNPIEAFPAVNDTITLKEGNYLVTKKLTINKAAMDYYRSVFLERNTCKTIDSFLLEQKTALGNMACEPSCSACTVQLGNKEQFRTNYFNALNVPAEERLQRIAEADRVYEKSRQDCDALCGRTNYSFRLRDMMVTDVTPPFGQYAKIDDQDAFSIFSPSFTTIVDKYRDITINYKDGNGYPDYAYLLNKTEFANNFKSSWADSLIKKHPEYLKLKRYEELEKNNNGWEYLFQETETYQDAVAKGFLNPLNFSGLPAGAAFVHNPAYADPLFNNLPASFKTKMKDSLDWTTGRRAGEEKISAWSLATIMAHCKQGDNTCFDLFKLPGQEFNFGPDCAGELDMAWKYFRGFYLQRRRMIIQEILDGVPYLENLKPVTPKHTLRFTMMPPDPTGEQFPQTYAEGEQQLNAAIEDNCRALSVQWFKDLKPCGLTPSQEIEIVNRMIQVCKEGGDVQHIYGASTVKPSSTHTDRSFEQVMRSVLGDNYNSNCNVYLISAPKEYNKQPIMAEKPLYGKPDSCDCASIDAMYTKYRNNRSLSENFSDYLYRTTQTVITQGALDTLRKSCNGEIICNFFPQVIKLPVALQCGVTDVCVGCDVVLENYDKFKFEFQDIIPSRTDTSAAGRAGNTLFAKYMNNQLGFGKTATEYLDFIDQCITAGKSCENLERIRLDYKYIPDYDSTHFYGYGDPVLQPKLRETYYAAWAHIPDSNVNNTGWGRRYGKLDTLCVGNVFTIVTRVKRPARDTSNTIVDLNISFNQDGHLQKIAPIFYFLKKSATSADSAFVRANSNKIGYVATGDTVGQLSQKIPDFTTWKLIKITHTADNYWRLYYNDTLVAERFVDSSVRNLLGFNVGFQGKADNGYVDYFKIYDGNNVLRYTEEFEDHIQSPSNAPVQFRCEDKCKEGFVRHFNKRMRTQYNYSQIDSVYAARSCTLLPPCGDSAVNRLIELRNEFRDEYYNYGIRRDVDGSSYGMWFAGVGAIPGQAAAVYPYRDVIKNGILQAPDTLNKEPLYRGSTLGVHRDTICVNGNFSLEMKLKFDGAFQTLLMFFKSGHHVQNLNVQMSTALSSCWIDYIETWRGTVVRQLGGVGNVPEFHNLNLSEWTTIKWKFANQQVGFYVNGVLKRTFTFPPEANFQTLTGWSWGTGEASRKVAPMAVDWVKYYDGRDSVFFFEDFNDPKNFARYPDSMHCLKKPCDETFAIFYNKRQGYTDLSLSQISQLYASKNVLMDICDDDLKLCGRNEPLFPVIIPKQRQACDDSTLFAVSTAAILHNYYKDSVLSSFDDRYIAKCLEVKATEQFTVEHNVNEYHYTLYYYDLAGNLVKTVPPAGVDISRFQWAAAWSDSVKLARTNKALLTPDHLLVTDYRYNTLNQVVEQKSPDGGRSEFWYDKLGRLAVSQNAKQRNAISGVGQNDWNYSFTRYDPIGRIYEVGEIRNLQNKSPLTKEMARDHNQLEDWFFELANRKSQITSTLYDIPYVGIHDQPGLISQRNLRNRVSAVFISDGGNPSLYNQATFYTYDIHGNVDTLLQDYGLSGYVPNIMNRNDNRFKKIEYNYDLISGKVNAVKYQVGKGDQFTHRYQYDAENRLTLVETSIDSVVWETDARYEYYLHGPLARTVLGSQQVQGVDYAYTLQGWLKGVNSTGASRQHDIGGDGKSLSPNLFTARDAYGFNLNYFTGDYTPVGEVAPFPGYSAALGSSFKPLYNGNISSMATAIRKFEDFGTYENGPNLFFNYQYDQLNRILSMDSYTGFNTAGNSYPVLNKLAGFKESFRYDANGNIQKLARYNKGADGMMDSLKYSYYPGTNMLRHVGDSIKANKWGVNDWEPLDIDSQLVSNNYIYDSIGNLIKDNAENILDIKWNVYGKIQEINRNVTPRNNVIKIQYTYDAAGNRISSIVDKANNERKYTWYVRDAQGNVMGVYEAGGLINSGLTSPVLNLVERYIYGSSRVGVERTGQNVDGGPWDAAQYYTNGTFMRGYRQYELSNHLGNVLTTITDRKFGVSSNGSLIDYYEPDMVSAADYYAFGSLMRSAAPQAYRFGFNGKENDNEVKGGEGLQQDYGMRVYDNRLGRFLSFDPLSKEYADLSPYHFAGNNPIQNLDKDGGEPLDFRSRWQWVRFSVNGGKADYYRIVNDPELGYISVEAAYDKVSKQAWFVCEKGGRDYYWKHNPGADQHSRISGHGQWVEFKTQDKIFLEQTAQLTRGMATGFAAAMAAPFAYGGISAAGSGLSSLGPSIMYAFRAAILNVDKSLPAIGTAGRVALEFADESGSVGLANTGVKRFAFGIGANAERLAGELGATHLMDFKGDWKAEFKRILGEASSEIHFDLTDLTHSGKINFDELSSILTSPKSNTQWEISTMYSEYYNKFKEAIFHYKDKTYKGSEIFDIND